MTATVRQKTYLWLALGAAALLPLGTASAQTAADGPVPVKIVKTATGYQLLRGGKPYFIKGAGGDGSKTELKAAGANSWRTWGADNKEGELAEAQRLGMTVTLGIWLGHKEYFSYEDAAAVAKQKEDARQDILKYRHSPALLQWGIGNEMETGGNEDDAHMWDAIEDIAKMAHALDPNHPTMVVVAEIGGDKVAQINAHCPDIDIVGINSYGGGPSVGQRYVAAGGTKPYEITEYGPPGTWEAGKNDWGIVPELTSTQKAARYKDTYVKTIAGQPLCLGSYAFTWGSKQEATATWFGLLLPDGDKLGAVDTLTQLWSGHAPATLCPVVSSLSVDGDGQAAPGTVVHAALTASDPQHEPLSVQWVLQADPETYKTGGGAEDKPPFYPEDILRRHGQSGDRPAAGGARRVPPVCVCAEHARRRGRRERLLRRRQDGGCEESRSAADDLCRRRRPAALCAVGLHGNDGGDQDGPGLHDAAAFGQNLPQSRLHLLRQLGRRRLAGPRQRLGRQARRPRPHGCQADFVLGAGRQGRRSHRVCLRPARLGQSVSRQQHGQDRNHADPILEAVHDPAGGERLVTDQDSLRVDAGRNRPSGDVLFRRCSVRVEEQLRKRGRCYEGVNALAGERGR